MLRRLLTRLRNHVWGPLDVAVAVVAGLALAAGLAFFLAGLGSEECGKGLQREGEECIGVTEYAFETDPEFEGLIQAVADENARVKKGWEDPGDNVRIPYVRIALMMPFASDATSAMTMDQIRRSLAGAHAAQLAANAEAGPYYQLLLANDGKDLDQWRPVVDRLAALKSDQSPLVGVIGMPSSTNETLKAIKVLSGKRIPSVGPVITSADMNAKYFFKTSPSNELLGLALEAYLADRPAQGKGFLVYDSRDRDVYSKNLRKVFMDRFNTKYGLRTRLASFVGVTGGDSGIPRRFSSAAQKICVTEADTIFFAGRDMDLPHLVRRLAKEPSCDHSKPMRILKVGIGIDPPLTTPDLTEQMKSANVTLVSAASVDPQWWEQNRQKPAGLPSFLKEFRVLELEHQLGAQPLDDGYAIMYYDAFNVVSQAVDQTFNDINDSEQRGSDAPVMPSKEDVYNTMIDMSILGTSDGAGCVNCIHGASGTFGYDDSRGTEKWPVCKPVPVIEYPAPPVADPPKKPLRLYRTHEDIFRGACP